MGPHAPDTPPVGRIAVEDAQSAGVGVHEEGGQEVLPHLVDDRLERIGRHARPPSERGPRDGLSETLVESLESIERQVVLELRDDQVSQELRTRHEPVNELRVGSRDDTLLAGRARELLSLLHDHLEVRRHELEDLARLEPDARPRATTTRAHPRLVGHRHQLRPTQQAFGRLPPPMPLLGVLGVRGLLRFLGARQLLGDLVDQLVGRLIDPVGGLLALVRPRFRQRLQRQGDLFARDLLRGLREARHGVLPDQLVILAQRRAHHLGGEIHEVVDFACLSQCGEVSPKLGLAFSSALFEVGETCGLHEANVPPRVPIRQLESFGRQHFLRRAPWRSMPSSMSVRSAALNVMWRAPGAAGVGSLKRPTSRRL